MVEIATARAGFYKHERDDLVVFSFARGTTCAGVFTRHKIGSAPVDWCRRQLDADGGGQDVRALVVNAGCAGPASRADGAGSTVVAGPGSVVVASSASVTVQPSSSLENHWAPSCHANPANWLMSDCEKLVM